MTAYKRFHKNLLKIFIVVAAAAAALIIVLSSGNVIQAEEERNPEKFYSCIHIEPGDSLWSIACTYMDGHYSSVQEYIDELKSINNLSSDTIHAYEYLLVPYFKAS